MPVSSSYPPHTHTHTQSNTSLLNTRHLHYQNKQTHKTKTITSYWKLHASLLRRFNASRFCLEMCDEYQTLAHMHRRWHNCRTGRFVVSSFKSLEYVCILKHKNPEMNIGYMLSHNNQATIIITFSERNAIVCPFAVMINSTTQL